MLRGAAEQCPDSDLREAIVEQSERIDQIVRYQRQRAAVAGISSVTRSVDVVPVLERLCAGLDKVHRDRGIAAKRVLPSQLMLRADQGDLFELFGNLLENAYKHARARVRISAAQQTGGIEVVIDDDGPGIATQDVDRVLRRGERADQHHPGEGIGLAVASGIVTQYQGTLSIGTADTGGASIRITLPG